MLLLLLNQKSPTPFAAADGDPLYAGAERKSNANGTSGSITVGQPYPV